MMPKIDWSIVPGVKYPSHGRLHVKHEVKKPERIDPKDWITTKEAAQLFGCSCSAVRNRLHKRKVPHCKVEGGALWKRVKVMQLLDKRNKGVVDAVPEGYVFTEDATALLGCGRSSLLRHTAKGLLKPLTVRVKCDAERGMRLHKMYSISEIEKLKVERAEIDMARQHYMDLIRKQRDDRSKN